MFNPKWVIGRTITQLEMNPFDDLRGGTAHNPVFVLDNGARLRFLTEETDTGDYGTEIVYHKPNSLT